jgi:hypothetical protein
LFFRSRILNAISFLILIGGFALLGYHGFDWWKSREQRKQLLIYFQQESPVTKRIPEDAIAYINLYDFKRVHSGLRDTRLYETIAHWIDTELSGNKSPNPLIGGMLEKTILNVIGEEFGLALLPMEKKSPEIFAVARLAPGSDFIVGLALTQNRKIKKIGVENETVYAIPAGPDLGEVYVAMKSGYAYACTDVQRIKSALQNMTNGPSFLKESNISQVPENTFLFARAKDPDFFAIVYGEGDTFTLNAPSRSSIYSSLPPIPGSGAIFEFQTNATEIFSQPSTSLAIHSIDGMPSSRLAFGFSSQAKAKHFGSSLLNEVNGTGHQLNFVNGSCVPLRIEHADWTFCSRGTSLLLAEEQFDPEKAEMAMSEVKPSKLPITLKIQNNSDALEKYYNKIKNGDWEDFDTAREFYFLSCLKNIRGSVDNGNDEIVAVVQ